MRLHHLLAAAACLAACARSDAGRDTARAPARRRDSAARPAPMPASALRLTSPAFAAGGDIPKRFTCDGANHSPPLAWTGAPRGTRAYALVVDDPDAPAGDFVHWVLYDLPATAASLPEGVAAGGSVPALGGARQGRTGFSGAPGYGGPCPPAGPAHHYHFRLSALDAPVGLDAGAARDQLAAAMRGHELARAELVGTYRR